MIDHSHQQESLRRDLMAKPYPLLDMSSDGPVKQEFDWQRAVGNLGGLDARRMEAQQGWP